MAEPDLARARAAHDRLVASLAGRAGVNGIGIGRADGGGYVLKVNLEADADGDAVPSEVDGVPVRRETVGKVRKRGLG